MTHSKYRDTTALSSQRDSQLHCTALNHSDSSIHIICSQAHILGGWRLESQLTLSCHLF
jgi:hypothetical protein